MKVLVALAVVALAAADSDSFYPGYGFQHGFPFAAHHQMGYNRLPYHAGFQGQQFPFVPYQQHQRLFRRDADSDSKSFYPGFPFVPATPYGFHQTPYMHGYGMHPYMHRPAVPMPVQQYTTYSHPLMANPLLKVHEVKEYPEVKEHKLEKRESDSDSDSFYPGFGFQHGHPFMPTTPYTGYPAYHQQQPYFPQTYGLPSVVPRVLPYNFPGYHYQSSLYKPVVEEKKE